MEVFLSPTSPNPPGNNFKILIFSQQSDQIVVNHQVPAGSIFGQAAVPGELAVGAVPAAAASTIESFSSEGPVQLGIPGSGTGTLAPTMRNKPDFVATDCVTVTGVGGFPSPFCGTSAATPHIAGLWALLKSAYPTTGTLSLLQTSSVQLTNAQPNGSGSPNGVFGNGRPDVDLLLIPPLNDFPPPTAVISTPSANISIAAGSKQSFSGSCNANGAPVAPSFDWSFGSGSGIADSSLANPTVTFGSAGTFTVTLTCTNSLGVASTSVKATVTAPSSGGGGDLGLLELAGLLSVLAISRRRRQPR